METGSTVTLALHVWRGQYAYVVMERQRSGRRHMIARGVLDRDADTSEDQPLLALLLAASEAYRASAEA